MLVRKFNLQAEDGAAGGGGAAGGEAGAGAGGAAGAGSQGAGAGAAAESAAGGETKGYWPADWRKNIAGDDEKELAQASRYASPADIWKKARALEQRLSSGELRPVLTKDAKPEEITAYRKAHGIPEAPDKYDLGKDVPVDPK